MQAGTESETQHGHVEGAVAAGQRAAQEALEVPERQRSAQIN
jgi:monoamine oxidase